MANGRAMALIGLTEDELVGKAYLDIDWDVVYEGGSPFPIEEFEVARAISDGRAVRQAVMGLRVLIGTLGVLLFWRLLRERVSLVLLLAAMALVFLAHLPHLILLFKLI